jgi:hypothetical protein
MENNEDKIRDYIVGRLSDNEKEAFEKRMKDDTTLAEEVNFYKDLKVAVIQSNFDKMLEETPERLKKKRKRNIQMVAFSISAAAVIVVIAMLTIFNEPDEVEEQQNYVTGTNYLSRYFEPPICRLNPTMLGANNQKTEDLAIKLYKEANYEKAALKFDELLQTNREEPILFYASAAYLATNQIDKAFDIVIELNNKEVAFKNHVKWYLALIYLEEDQNENALPLLNELSDSKNEFKDKAKEILTGLH